MDGGSAKKSLETLVIHNINNETELKNNLNDIIKAGKDYEYDVSSSLQSLLISGDSEIVQLTVQAIAELSKCEVKRMKFGNVDTIQPILNVLRREITSDSVDLAKQCCRALGNLCCDSDGGRQVILERGGVRVLKTLLRTTVDEDTINLDEIKLFTCKIILNFVLGGQVMCQAVVDEHITDILQTVLEQEVDKDDMNDHMVQTCLLLLSLINDNTPELVYPPTLNGSVLTILKETSNIDTSDLCLEHLHVQVENDSVKTLLAREGGVELVCCRLELLLARKKVSAIHNYDSDVDLVMKKACDLIIIILVGDDAMNLLYNNGVGEVYLTMVRWLDSTNLILLSTAILAIGNFARQDTYCEQMMENKIFDKLLDIFETYQGFYVRIQKNPYDKYPIDEVSVTRIQHAALSAIRNLIVPVCNKRVAAASGRAATVMISALPHVRDHHVAYKLLAAIRLLVDGQEGVARALSRSERALEAVSEWGRKPEYAGAAGEAPRLLAWTIKQLRHDSGWTRILQVDGCVTCLVTMLVSPHSVMQNEAILALTLLAMESLNNKRTPQTEHPPEFDYEKSFITQIIKTEIGKHIAVLIETNCAKMPVEVAENLLAFLDITAKKNNVAADYNEAKVNDSLKKFVETRKDLNDDLKSCIEVIISLISDNGKLD